MRSRVLLAGALVAACASLAHAERTVEIACSSNGQPIAGNFYLGTQHLGEPVSSIQTVFAGSFQPEDGDATPEILVARMVPAEGIPDVGKRAKAGIRVFHPDDVQFWASLDESNWKLLPANQGATFELTGPNGTYTRVTFIDTGSNGIDVATAGVPAVSSVGFGVMFVLAVSAAAATFRRKRRPA